MAKPLLMIGRGYGLAHASSPHLFPGPLRAGVSTWHPVLRDRLLRRRRAWSLSRSG